MKRIFVDKVTLNIGAGEGGEKLDKAKTILERISGRKPVITKTHRRSTFAARNRPIGVKVTLRGKAALNLLTRLVKAVEGVKKESFDNSGNFSFGISEYIDIPDMEYDPKIGMFGLDVAVTLTRPGYNVKKKFRLKKIGKEHLISKGESMEFAKKLGIKILEGETS